ncbi:hypothetical protein MMC28_000152 [Mycoblastus sanguinarius]|nr:hypothetical protein [Mycoblastus sanguinarius]
MISQVEPFLDFEECYVLDQYDETEDYYKSAGQKPRPWSFGKIYRSMTGLYALDGKLTRTPGSYFKVDPDTGKSTGKPLRDTMEYIHPSARSRIVLRGPGVEDDGRYDCHPLDHFKLRFIDETADKRPTAFWEPRSRRKGSRQKDLPESPLWGTEKELLKESPRMYEYVLGGPRRS